MIRELEETKKFYSCRYDRTFKEVFLKEENEDLLVTLLELTLSLKVYEIQRLNVETLQGNIEMLAVEFNYENQCFDKLWKQLKKMEAKSNNMNGNGARKPRRSKQKSSTENNDKSVD